VITRSTASAFPLDDDYYSATVPTTPQITGVTIGNQGDLVLLHVTAGSSSTAIPGPTVTSIGVTGAPGLNFQKMEALAYVSNEGIEMETWYAVVPASSAGAAGVAIVANLTATANYYALVVDEFSAGLGASTSWIVEVFNEVFTASSATPVFPNLTTPTSDFEMAYIGYLTLTGVGAPTATTSPVNGEAFIYSITSTANVVAFGPSLASDTAYQPGVTTSSAAASGAIGAIWLAYVPGESTSGVDQHLMDAEQVEVNTQATPGPSSWQPPRDIQVNLIPVRQNLITNPVGRGGTFGWSLTGGLLQGSISLATPPGIDWPEQTTTGFVLASSGTTMTMTATIPANPEQSYTFSVYVMAASVPRAVELVLDFVNSSNVVISTGTQAFTEQSAQFYRGTIVAQVAPANTASVRVQIVIASSVTGEQHYVGGTLLEMSSFAGVYFDGNYDPITDYVWEGTPNQSVSDYYPNLVTKLSRLATVLPNYTPIGSTFSIFIGAQALGSAGLVD
jgi:hypothetical protein